MVRQKCLTSSLARQSDPMTVLRNYEGLAKASAALIQTDIPTSDLPGLLAVAQQVPNQQISAVSLVPPLVDPVHPKYSEIHAMVQRLLAGEPAVPPDDSTGDGTVGNAGSSASAATQGSVPASTGGQGGSAQDGSTQGGLAQGGGEGGGSGDRAAKPAAGQKAAELGLVCQPV